MYDLDLDLDLDDDRPLLMWPCENERDRLEAQYIGEREIDLRRRSRDIERLRRKLLLRREIDRRRLE